MRIVPSLNRINKNKKKVSSEKFEITKFCVLSQRSKINILSTENRMTSSICNKLLPAVHWGSEAVTNRLNRYRTDRKLFCNIFEFLMYLQRILTISHEEVCNKIIIVGLLSISESVSSWQNYINTTQNQHLVQHSEN